MREEILVFRERKRATGEEIVGHFESLPRGAGSAEDRVAATARYFKVKPTTVMRHIQFWWPGRKFLSEFGEKESRRPKWDRPTEELLDAMREHKSVNKAAKVLNTTPITLSKALERHHIVQTWVVERSAR
jgi:hypothetical protein